MTYTESKALATIREAARAVYDNDREHGAGRRYASEVYGPALETWREYHNDVPCLTDNRLHGVTITWLHLFSGDG